MRDTQTRPTVPFELVDRVDAEQLRVVWLVDDFTTTGIAIRKLKEEIDAHGGPKPGGRIYVSHGNEAYRHKDGGWLRIVPAWRQSLRGVTADLIVDDTRTARWSKGFCDDIDVMRVAGARLIESDRG